MSNITRTHLTVEQLTTSFSMGSQIDNRWFTPFGATTKSKSDLCITIDVMQTEMFSNHRGFEVNNKQVDVFPACKIRLTSIDNVLVPVDRDLLHDRDGQSYWDISLSPGEVWSEAGDGQWSRAVLPFQLSNILESDSRHGLAMFLFTDSKISSIYFQIVAETKAFVAPEKLLAWGYLSANRKSLDPNVGLDAVRGIRLEIEEQHGLYDLDSLKSEKTRLYFDEMESGTGSDSTLVHGLIINDEIFSTPCRTPVGDYPYPRAMKFGIWSATKTAFATVACLRLAQSFGVDPRSAFVGDLLPEAKGFPAWQGISIGDCLNMATGIGTAASDADPPRIFGDYLLEKRETKGVVNGAESYRRYYEWYLALSQYEKSFAALSCPSYSWGPGERVRYRDQDLYIAGAAMDAWLKRQQGSEARIWNVVRDEVYEPAGVYNAIKFHTVEADLHCAVPLSDAGLLLTTDNIAALGRLIHNHGKINQEQVLHPEMLDEVFNPRICKGLPTGTFTADGEVYYHAGTWHLPYMSNNKEMYWIPVMRGYGGQFIYILPNGVTAFRFGFDSCDTEERYDMLKLVRLADAIQPF